MANPFYDGRSASKEPDSRFRESAALPRLASYIPQGIGTCWNWSGRKNLLLVVMYHPGRNSIIVGIDPTTEKVVGDVAIAPTHGGGITTVYGWAFVQGSTNGVRKYKPSALAAAMKKPGTPYVKATGAERKVYGASFLTSYGDGVSSSPRATSSSAPRPVGRTAATCTSYAAVNPIWTRRD
jgi:hypothetical protein